MKSTLAFLKLFSQTNDCENFMRNVSLVFVYINCIFFVRFLFDGEKVEVKNSKRRINSSLFWMGHYLEGVV